MNDYDRFTRQMNDTLDILKKAIETLDAPIAQKDKLSGLAWNLREFAYQAGRTESAASIPDKNRIVEPPARSQRFKYKTEFGDWFGIDHEIEALVLNGLMSDESWHNDTIPHFERVLSDRKILMLWIEEENPDDRENAQEPYMILLARPDGTTDGAETLLATEDTSEAVSYVRSRIMSDLTFVH